MMRHLLRPAALAALAACAGSAIAADGSEPSIFSFSGFGTVGVTRLSSGLADYSVGYQKEGTTDEWSVRPDTKLGGQVSAKFNDSFSATGQLFSRYNYKGSWTPEVQWLFAKAKVGSDFSVRVGRIGAPLFMVSDYRSVDYANTWLRPPRDVYGQVNFDHFDGVDGNYQGDLGGATVSAQLFAGKTKGNLVGGGTFEVNKMVGINASAEVGPVTFRLGHTQGKLVAHTTALDGLIAGLNGASQIPGLGGLKTLSDELVVNGKKATFTGAGVSVDYKNFIGLAEYTVRKTDSYVADTTGWYVTGGYRVGKFTPYLTFSKLTQDSPTSSSVVPPLEPLKPLRLGVASLLRSTGQQSTGVGLRWDAGSSFSVKGQVENVTVDTGGTGLFSNVKSGFADTMIYSVSVDFVF
jgi:hypothetical protein